MLLDPTPNSFILAVLSPCPHHVGWWWMCSEKNETRKNRVRKWAFCERKCEMFAGLRSVLVGCGGWHVHSELTAWLTGVLSPSFEISSPLIWRRHPVHENCILYSRMEADKWRQNYRKARRWARQKIIFDNKYNQLLCIEGLVCWMFTCTRPQYQTYFIATVCNISSVDFFYTMGLALKV